MKMQDDVVFFVLWLCVLKEVVTAIEELEKPSRVDEHSSIDPILVGAAFEVGWPLSNNASFAKVVDGLPNEYGVKLVVTAHPIRLI